MVWGPDKWWGGSGVNRPEIAGCAARGRAARATGPGVATRTLAAARGELSPNPAFATAAAAADMAAAQTSPPVYERISSPKPQPLPTPQPPTQSRAGIDPSLPFRVLSLLDSPSWAKAKRKICKTNTSIHFCSDDLGERFDNSAIKPRQAYLTIYNLQFYSKIQRKRKIPIEQILIGYGLTTQKLATKGRNE